MTDSHVIAVLALAVAALSITLFFHNTRYSRVLFWTLSGLLLALLFHAEAWKRPVSSDGYYYYVWLVSAWFDHDVDLTNNYAACGNPYGFGLTRTGYADTVFPVGCAVLWLPFFAVGQCLRMLLGLQTDAAAGMSLFEQRMTVVGTLIYAVVGLLLLFRLLKRDSSERTALFSLSCMLWGTFLAYYLTSRPSMSEGCSFFTQSVFLFLISRARADASLKDSLLLGLVLGLSTAARYHNLASACLLVPLFVDWRKTERWKALSARMVAVFLGVLLGLLPQAYVLIRLYGWPPTLGSAARLVGISNIVDLPSVLLSPDHGLIYWHPIAALGIAGLVSLQRSKVSLDKCMLLAFVLHLAANSIGLTIGAAFGARRFAGAIPLLAVGFSHLLDRFCATGHRWRQILSVGITVPLVLWNIFIWTTLGQRSSPREAADLTAMSALSRRDRPVGSRRTFYLGRQHDGSRLLRGWGPVQFDADLSYRAMTAERASLTLRFPAYHDIVITIRARSLGGVPCQVRVLVGRSEVAAFQVSTGWQDYQSTISAEPDLGTQKLWIVASDQGCRSVAMAWVSLVSAQSAK